MDTDPKAYVDQAAALIGLEIAPGLHPAVVANFAQFVALMARIEGFDDPEIPDPPAVFRP